MDGNIEGALDGWLDIDGTADGRAEFEGFRLSEGRIDGNSEG